MMLQYMQIYFRQHVGDSNPAVCANRRWIFLGHVPESDEPARKCDDAAAWSEDAEAADNEAEEAEEDG